MRSRQKVTSAGLATLAAAALFGLAGCPEDKPAAPAATTAKPAPTAAPTAKPTAAPAAATTGTGVIKGTVAFTGTAPEAKPLNRKQDPVCAKDEVKDPSVVVNSNKTLKDVLVRIAPGEVKGKFDAPASAAVLNQEKCMYTPRVLGAVAGQQVEIKNSDQTMHNVHTYKGQETVFNQAQPAGAPAIKKEFEEAGVIKFKCDVHPWMEGYVVVTDHPYFTVTGDDGSFTLSKVPPGKYKVEAWHPVYGAKTTEVTAENDKTAEAKFEYAGTEKAQ